ncbi:MAG: MFS transporter [Planctomycetes bacterium]|nr:MFS transporter [Planctomycetota bacterium]
MPHHGWASVWPDRRSRTIVGLGTAQTLAWASTYYLPAMLAGPMAHELGVGTPTVFAAFSGALVIAAILGPVAGRRIDVHGGRLVLVATSLIAALGLALLAVADDPLVLFLAWGVLGIAMGGGLYEAAFATIVRLYGRDARGAITGVTLMAGFASTAGWPLTAWWADAVGWRGACAVWALLHLAVGLPIHLRLPSPSSGAGQHSGPCAAAGAPSHRPAAGTAILLALAFAVTWFTSTAMAAHLPRILQLAGLGLAAAVAVAALVGPAQVGARLLEFLLMRRMHPLLSARLAGMAHPLGAALLLILGPAAAGAFALLHGAGNGILTIAKGTLPLILFGPAGYGARQGLLMLPARLAQAAAPFLFGLAMERYGLASLWLSLLLGLIATAALLRLRAPVASG